MPRQMRSRQKRWLSRFLHSSSNHSCKLSRIRGLYDGGVYTLGVAGPDPTGGPGATLQDCQDSSEILFLLFLPRY
jgi:hypothetical protein